MEEDAKMDDGMMEDDEGMMMEDVTDARTIEVIAKNWAFTPDIIRAKKGEEVELVIRSTSGTHGFAVPDLDVNIPIAEGESVTISLPTDQAGTFDFRCSVPCGAGHTDMTGQIIIEE